MNSARALNKELGRLIRAQNKCEARGESAMAYLLGARRAQLEMDNLPVLQSIRDKGEGLWLKG